MNTWHMPPCALQKQCPVLYHCNRQSPNNRSRKGGIAVYNEPDWSSLSVLELLEKAQGFAKQAFGKSLRSYAFIERAIDRMPVGNKRGEEHADLMEKAQSVYQTIAKVQQQITQITQKLSQRTP